MNAVDILNELNQLFKIDFNGEYCSFYIPFNYNQKESTLSELFKIIDDVNTNETIPYNDWKLIDTYTIVLLDSQSIADKSFNDSIKNKKFWCVDWRKSDNFYIYDFKTHCLKHVADGDNENGSLLFMKWKNIISE